MKLGLGTAQFGMPYGISNRNPVPESRQVQGILRLARSRGVRLIDTAALYGQSERVLGEALQGTGGDDANPFEIVTKTIKRDLALSAKESAQAMARRFEQSLRDLGVPRVHALLAHGPDDLLGDGAEEVFAVLQGAKAKGNTRKIGVSVYSPEQAERILDRFALDVVQLPLNLLDQRFVQAGALGRLKAAGVELHARSAFLQGLLLMKQEEIPFPVGDGLAAHLAKMRRHFQNQGISGLEACLKFVSGIAEVDHVVVGVGSALEWSELLEAFERVQIGAVEFARECGPWAWPDERVLNPSLWPK